MKTATKTTLSTALAMTLVASHTLASSTVTVTDPAAPLSGTGASVPTPTTDQAAIGTGSWQANGATKSSTWFTPESLGFDAGTTIADVEEMSFKTYKSTTGGSAVDWYLTIYTAPTGNTISDNGSSWYGVRMTWEGLYANNLSNPADQWNTWSTASGTNQLTMLDSNTTNFGFYGAPTLEDIHTANGIIDWSTYPTSSSTATFDYDESEIIGFVFETGSGWASGFDGYLDEFSVTVGGETTVVDFEQVPEPTSMALLAVGGLSMLRRRR